VPGLLPHRHWNPHKQYPLLIEPVRALLLTAGVPYVIENVEGARDHMRDPILLCGPTFGLRVYRHRLFECSKPVAEPQHLAEHPWPQTRRGRPPVGSEFHNPIGNFIALRPEDDYGIDWMRRAELSQAIPPAYTRYIGAGVLRGNRDRNARGNQIAMGTGKILRLMQNSAAGVRLRRSATCERGVLHNAH